MAKFQIDLKQSQELESKMKQVPENAERLVNEVVHTKGSKYALEGIIEFMPLSDRDKAHAKLSNPLKIILINLGFEVLPKPKFRFLVFPNDGLGRSNPVARQFFEKGLDSRSEKILNEVMAALQKAIEI